MKSNAGKMILALEELQEANIGYLIRVIEFNEQQRYWSKDWIGGVSDILNKRAIMIQNKSYHYNQITSNETIIDYAF